MSSRKDRNLTNAFSRSERHRVPSSRPLLRRVHRVGLALLGVMLLLWLGWEFLGRPGLPAPAEPAAAALEPTETARVDRVETGAMVRPTMVNGPDDQLPEARIVADFYAAWAAGEHAAMYQLLTTESQAEISQTDFISRYVAIEETALIDSISTDIGAGEIRGSRLRFPVEVGWETAIFGEIVRSNEIELSAVDGEWRVVWAPTLILPELLEGRSLTAEIRPSPRGGIYDINGQPLAVPGEMVTIGVIPGQIAEEDGLVAALGDALQRPYDEIRSAYAFAQPTWFVPIADVPRTEYDTFATELAPYLDGGGLRADFRPARLYARGAPHMVGYLGIIPQADMAEFMTRGYTEEMRVGLSGLEKWGEPILQQMGGRLAIVDENNELIKLLVDQEPPPSGELYTTFDLNFQTEVQRVLGIAASTHPTSTQGAAVVLDVDTGAILALASYPDYDPSLFDISRPFALEDLTRLINDPGRPLVNRTIQGTYPPGSIFKIVTTAAALNSGLYTFDTLYESTGAWDKLGGSFVKYDWLEGGHGLINLEQALVVSCNTCFYDAGYQIDEIDPFFLPDIAREFGLGQVTGLRELEDEPGIIPDPDWKDDETADGAWVVGDAVNMAIGQGYVSVTPLQMAQMAAAVANEGWGTPPYLLSRIDTGTESILIEPRPEDALRIPMDDEALARVQQAMVDVTIAEDGTARDVFSDFFDVPVAGKTGTAENPQGAAHAWFVGYAPAVPYTTLDGRLIEKPEIAIAVLMENGGSGADFAAPIFREITAVYYGVGSTLPYPWYVEE